MNPLLDSNVLIYLVDSSSLYHKEALSTFKKCLQNGCFLPDLCLIEFYQVITDTRKTLTPFSIEEAVGYIELILSTPEIEILHVNIREIMNHHNLKENLKKYEIVRYDIYDFLIASCMRSYGVRQIITFNAKDFIKYEWVEAINPRNKSIPL